MASDIPTTEHFAIITFSSISIPGDERSRTNPGHGYSASTERVVHYTVYADQDEWEAAITTLTIRGDVNFVPIAATPAKVTTKIKVEIDK